MTRLLSARALIVAGACLLPFTAHAQSQNDTGFDVGEAPPATEVAPPSNNWITIGGQYNSGRSYYIGRYNGTVDPGLYGLGDLHLSGRDPWDSGGTNYWDIQGSNLGFWDRSMSVRIGQQGSWGLSFTYDGIPYYANNDFQTIFQQNGNLVPGVAPGSLGVKFVQIAPASGKVNSLWAALPANSPAALLRNQDLSTRRDVFTGTGKYQWGDWTITGAYRHEHKEGYQANSLEFGGAPGPTSAGSGAKAPTAFTSGLAYFAQPIDYDTDRYDLNAAYGTEKLQIQAGYTFSKFTDNATAFVAQNPFAFTPTTTFGTAAANLTGVYALPPSNSENQVRLMVGYNVSPTMRVNANVEYGFDMQDNSLLAGTGDPVNNPTLPVSTFSARAQTLNGNLAITAEPLPRIDVRLAYTVNEYDNHSASNSFPVDTRSNTSTSANGDCTNGLGLCVNLPYSYQHQTFTAEAGYRILPQTKLLLTESFEIMDRTYANSSLVTTNTVTAKLRSDLAEGLFGALSYSHQDREAHDYINNATWAELGTTLADPGGFLMYFESSRVHDEVKTSLDVSSSNTITGSVMFKLSSDRYPGGTYGLRNNHNLQFGPDVSWQPTPDINAHAFYTFQQIYYDQSSLYSTSGYTVPWSVGTTDKVQTVGITVDWQAIKDVLKFGFDYNFSYGDTAYVLGDSILIYGTATSPATVPSLTSQPLPDVNSMLNMVSMHSEYTFRPNMTLLFGYAFEKFNYKDFMYSAAQTQYANMLLPGTLVPNGTVHTVGAALRVRF